MTPCAQENKDAAGHLEKSCHTSRFVSNPNHSMAITVSFFACQMNAKPRLILLLEDRTVKILRTCLLV